MSVLLFYQLVVLLDYNYTMNVRNKICVSFLLVLGINPDENHRTLVGSDNFRILYTRTDENVYKNHGTWVI